jgi:hypothetical protein
VPGVVFSKDAAKRTKEAVLYVERSIKNSLPSGIGPRGMVPGLMPVKSPSGGIPAMSGSTPGSATCTLYTYDGTDFTLGTETITVKNVYSSSTAGNNLTWVAWWSGAWFVITEGC